MPADALVGDIEMAAITIEEFPQGRRIGKPLRIRVACVVGEFRHIRSAVPSSRWACAMCHSVRFVANIEYHFICAIGSVLGAQLAPVRSATARRRKRKLRLPYWAILPGA